MEKPPVVAVTITEVRKRKAEDENADIPGDSSTHVAPLTTSGAATSSVGEGASTRKRASSPSTLQAKREKRPVDQFGDVVRIKRDSVNEDVNIDDNEPDDNAEEGVDEGEEHGSEAKESKEMTASEKQLSILNPSDEAARHKPRITVHGLPKQWTQKKFLKMLSEVGVVSEKARKIPNQVYGMLTFVDNTTRDAAAEKIRNAGYKTAETKHTRMGVGEPQLPIKQREEPRPSGGGDEGETAALVDETTLRQRTARSVVTPWADQPYETQLAKKAEEARHVLVEITKCAIKESSYNVPLWLKALKGLPICPLENDSVFPSPRIQGYRNKLGWTIGFDYDAKPVIGHLLGQTKDGIISVGDPSDCPNVPPLAEALRLIVSEFIMKSGFAPWHKLSHKGVWRTLTVRTTESQDAMVIVQACCAEVKDITALKNALKEHTVAETTVKKIAMKSLYFQDYRGVSNSAPPDLPFELLYGDDVITETLSGLSFRISPNSFFQVNTKAAEVLYSLVARWCCPNKEPTTVMDIYCGTGSIGLCVARSVREVCGIEVVDAAVKDAKANAKLNGIENTAWFAGKAEDLLGKKLWEWAKRSPNFVGIVDPPRAGLHLEAIKAIRGCKPMKRLIYVSCNQRELVRNAAALCRAESNTMRGLPFRPIIAAAVDLFPHTEHCEMIMLFERAEAEKDEKKGDKGK